MTLVAVVLAGALGAGSRVVVDHVVTRLVRWTVQAGTLVINVTGSAVAGVLAGWVARHGLDEGIRVVVGSGFLAAYTTFSTFAVESLRLLEEGELRSAALSVAAQVVLSGAAAGLGYAALVAT